MSPPGFMPPSTFAPRPRRHWLDSPLGQRLLARELALVTDVLEQAFGEDLVQIGTWGAPRAFLERARTQRANLIDVTPGPGVCAVGAWDALPLATHSVDVLLLPHTLEQAYSPHALLREVDRVLRPDGKLVILGLSPYSPMGVRRVVTGRRFPPAVSRFVSEHRVRDWLQLLDCQVRRNHRFLFGWPMQRGPGDARQAAIDTWCDRWLPLPVASGYLLVANKRQARINAQRLRWRRRLRVVGGLAEAEPTARANGSAARDAVLRVVRSDDER